MGWTEFDNDYNIMLDYLDEYQTRAMNDAVSAFGYNEKTVNGMLYVWFGMELQAFVDEMLGDKYGI